MLLHLKCFEVKSKTKKVFIFFFRLLLVFKGFLIETEKAIKISGATILQSLGYQTFAVINENLFEKMQKIQTEIKLFSHNQVLTF